MICACASFCFGRFHLPHSMAFFCIQLLFCHFFILILYSCDYANIRCRASNPLSIAPYSISFLTLSLPKWAAVLLSLHGCVSLRFFPKPDCILERKSFILSVRIRKDQEMEREEGCK